MTKPDPLLFSLQQMTIDLSLIKRNHHLAGTDESVIGWDGIVDYDDKGNVIAESASNNLSTCWKYGWDRAMGILADVTKTLSEDMNLSEYKMWLDVETDNSWQSGSPEAQAKNVAVLEGMTACFNHTVGMEVGIYSARSLFNEIAGDQIRDDSNLTGLDTWLAMGDVSEERAKELLERGTLEGFTKGSQVVMLQTVIEDSNGVKLDYNYMLPK